MSNEVGDGKCEQERNSNRAFNIRNANETVTERQYHRSHLNKDMVGNSAQCAASLQQKNFFLHSTVIACQVSAPSG